ncbi:MAG: NADP-dependent methylenetetrahydromethanopterin/methylenetetrahydrofolate dehydrogenase [Thermoleophilia bacterium]
MKKILLQLDGDRVPSVFDAITAYDAGADVLLQHGGVEVREVRDLVHGAMFTRGVGDLKNSAVFIGGTDVGRGEAMLREVGYAFFGPLRVSVMLDANGCNTTATAAVVKILSAGDLSGKKVVILAGTGPVGQRAAGLLAKEGAEVTLTSRTVERAEAVCVALGERFGVKIAPAACSDTGDARYVLEGAHAVLCAGAAGVPLVSEAIWRNHPTLRVLADVNAVPPLGVEGSEVTWSGKEIDGKKLFGAIGIGDFKMKVHRRCIAKLFEQNDLVLDAEEILALAKELAE